MIEHGARMPDVAAPSEPEPAAARHSWASHARRLFLFRSVELGWIVAYALILRVLPLFGVHYGSLPGVDSAVELLWTVFAAIQVGLLAGLRREVAARTVHDGRSAAEHPAAGLLLAAFVLAMLHLAESMWFALTTVWAPAAALAFGPVTGSFSLLLSLAFDVVFWLALERLLGRVAPALRAVFFAARLVTFGLSSLSMLSFDTYRSLLLTGAMAPFYGWMRLALSVSWNVAVVVALQRLSRRAPAAAPEAAAARPDGATDLVMGAIWLAGGLLVTLGTYSAAASGGGQYVVTTGAIVYGVVRIARGLARREPR